MKFGNRLWHFTLVVALVLFVGCPWWAGLILFYALLATDRITLVLRVLLLAMEKDHDDAPVEHHLSIVTDNDREAS